MLSNLDTLNVKDLVRTKYVDYIYCREQYFLKIFSYQVGSRLPKFVENDDYETTQKILDLAKIIQNIICHNYSTIDERFLLIVTTSKYYYFVEVDDINTIWYQSRSSLIKKSILRLELEFIDFFNMEVAFRDFCSSIGVHMGSHRNAGYWKFSVVEDRISVVKPPTNFLDLYTSSKLSDFNILSGNATFATHRCVLYMWGGDYFKTLFSTDMKGGQADQISLNDFAPTTIHLYLTLVYSDVDTLKFADEVDLIELYQLSHYLLNKRCIELCETLLYRTADIDNIKTLVDLYRIYGGGDLFHIISKLISTTKILIPGISPDNEIFSMDKDPNSLRIFHQIWQHIENPSNDYPYNQTQSGEEADL